MLPKCAFPKCARDGDQQRSRELRIDGFSVPRVEVAEGDWCADHVNTACGFPPCEELTKPRSSFCPTHNALAEFFDWMAAVRTDQAIRQQQSQQIAQSIRNGGSLYRGRG